MYGTVGSVQVPKSKRYQDRYFSRHPRSFVSIPQDGCLTRISRAESVPVACRSLDNRSLVNLGNISTQESRPWLANVYLSP